MSALVEHNSPSRVRDSQTTSQMRGSPREMNRPAQLEAPNRPMQQYNMQELSSAKPTHTGGSPSMLRQATVLSASNSHQESQPDLNSQGPGRVLHHYEVPNLSSMLYQFTNEEKDRVARAFRTGNYLSLRDLPRHLLPGNVSQVSRSKIE